MNRLMLLGFLLATATAQGSGTLQLGEPTVEQDRITVPVVLGGDLSGGVSAMDFRFRYNPEALQPVSVVAGTAAERADKRVMSNQRTPGEYAVVMMGFNQSSCGPGEAIRIVLQRLQGPDQKWDLSLSDPTMSSVDGRLIESQVLPSDIEPAREVDQGQEEEETGRQPRLPEVDTGAEEAGPVKELAAPQGAGYDAPMDGPVAEGASRTAAAESLKAALQSAEEVRQGIESPEQNPADQLEGLGQEAGVVGETGLNVATESGGRIDTAGVTASGRMSPDQALRNNTVEPQSGTNAVERRGGTYMPFAVAGFCVLALAAVLVWRRSRLIG
ncbi:MAG TPA: cohesin domain-containing protein [Candidatus Bathyarchaeia archaeon]|nr:cohesin domain-containing protein [Candidatus Bathyarchaeia archaeon]